MGYVEGLVVDRCTELINKLTRPYLAHLAREGNQRLFIGYIVFSVSCLHGAFEWPYWQ